MINVALSLFSRAARANQEVIEFTLSATDDADPTPNGHWEPLSVVQWSTSLERTDWNRLRTTQTPDERTIYMVVARIPLRRTTAFRLEAFRAHRDFVLKEFRVEPQADSTNIALGALVSASDPVIVDPVTVSGVLSRETIPPAPFFRSNALTDGLAYSLSHPQDPELGANFFFQIDLGKVYALDHIALRQRNNTWDINRFSRVFVRLYDQEPASGANSRWDALDRADGTYPEVGTADVLRASNGQGEFRGRFLRLSSDSPVPKSPMFAEVEVYETRTPKVIALRADDREIRPTPTLSIPPRTRRLFVSMQIPQIGLPEGHTVRWRLLGYRDEWQSETSLAVNTYCPPPGNYTFEAQAVHSDGLWDSSSLSVPIAVLPPFVQTPAFRWLVASAALLFGVVLTRSFTRRRIALLEARSELADERARIARDMHDEVGARLAQLAVLQDVFVAEQSLSEGARENVRQLARIARQAVASLDGVVWTVDPQHDTLASTVSWLTQHATDYLTPLGIACRIVAPVDWPHLEIRAQVRHQLNLAFKEALQNIVKHSEAREVTLTFNLQPESQHFTVRLADNGCGMPSEPQGPHRDGLRNMTERLTSIGGTLQVQSPPGGGVTVEMRVPVPRVAPRQSER